MLVFKGSFSVINIVNFLVSMDFTNNPLYHFPITQYSIVPVFHCSNPPSAVVLLRRTGCEAELSSGNDKKRKKEDDMSKKGVIGILTMLIVLGVASVALAEDGAAKAAGMWIFFGIALACGFGIGIAAFGTGLGMGNAVNAALSGIARNPEASGKFRRT
jgi:hypothetical protein